MTWLGAVPIFFSLLPFAYLLYPYIPKHPVCMLPHSMDGYVGRNAYRCHGKIMVWTFVKEHNLCMQFQYGGCGGNQNNFPTKEHCEIICKIRNF